jgi:hypothetical protein
VASGRWLPWRSRIDPTHQALVDNDESQYREHNPGGTIFPVQIKGKAGERDTAGDPKNQQASSLCHIPMRARVHDVLLPISRTPCRSGESGITPPDLAFLPYLQATAGLPLKKCRRSMIIPTINRMWTKPVETWKAKKPSNQRTIRTAAIIPSMSSTP